MHTDDEDRPGPSGLRGRNVYITQNIAQVHGSNHALVDISTHKNRTYHIYNLGACQSSNPDEPGSSWPSSKRHGKAEARGEAAGAGADGDRKKKTTVDQTSGRMDSTSHGEAASERPRKRQAHVLSLGEIGTSRKNTVKVDKL
jgi:hypothetical protein